MCAEYVLVHPAATGPSGPSWIRYSPISPFQATRLVLTAITAAYPDQRLLRFFHIREHPHNLAPDALRSAVARCFDSLAAPRLFRVEQNIAAPKLEVIHVTRESLPSARSERADHYIVVEVASKQGKPVNGVRLEITAPDGSVRTLITDHRGRVSIDGLDAGSCKIALPTVDRSAWSLQGARGQLVEKAPGDVHMVRAGECLSQLAHAYGIPDWQTIWSDGKNEALRKRRKSPHVLMPGDQLYVPGVDVAAVQRPTDSTHRITLDSGSALVDLVLTFEDFEGKPRASEPYELAYDGGGATTKIIGHLTAGGELREKIPADVQMATLTFTQSSETFQLALGELNPASDSDATHEQGTAERLAALGYLRWSGAQEPAGDLTAALRDFQRLVLGQTSPTGELNAVNANKLEELYGA